MARRRESWGMGNRHRDFRTTRWTLIQQATAENASSRQAMEELCTTYWYPLYTFVRRRGYDMNNACDLTQGFFEQLLRRDAMAVADSKRGRFRHFLMRSLSNFLSNEHARNTTIRRGGGAPMIRIDPRDADARYQTVADDNTPPDRLFDREWAMSILEQTFSQLRAGFSAEGKEGLFDAIKKYLNFESDAAGYDATARTLNLTAAAVKTAVYRLRRRYRDTLRAIIAETVSTDAEVDDEIAMLFEAVKR